MGRGGGSEWGEGEGGGEKGRERVENGRGWGEGRDCPAGKNCAKKPLTVIKNLTYYRPYLS